MTPLEIGILGCIALVLLLFSGMPVAYSMALVGTVGFAAVRCTASAAVGFGAVTDSARTALSLLSGDVYDQFSSYSLTVIPLFVLMGQLAFHAGISRRLFAATYSWMGRLPGGLAIATVGACTAFGAICGSGPATSATMASVALPEMKRYKYSPALATGTVASGGTLGMMIPPSVVFICYGMLTQQSIGKLFVSGILPGLLTAAVFCGTISWMCWRNPSLGPAGPATKWRQKFASLGGLGETLVLFALVMGGMFWGLFTPTEGAAVGAGGTLLLALARRQISLPTVWRSVQETLRTSCMVIFIIAGAVVFGHFLGATGIPGELAAALSSMPLPGWVIMIFIAVFYMIGGCFVDALALLMLTVPIFYPVVEAVHYDPIWFGVVMVLVTQLGTVTPPVGVCAYVVAGIDKDVPLPTVFRGCMPFIVGLVAVIVLLMVFPSIATWLPSLMR